MVARLSSPGHRHRASTAPYLARRLFRSRFRFVESGEVGTTQPLTQVCPRGTNSPKRFGGKKSSQSVEYANWANCICFRLLTQRMARLLVRSPPKTGSTRPIKIARIVTTNSNSTRVNPRRLCWTVRSINRSVNLETKNGKLRSRISNEISKGRDSELCHLLQTVRQIWHI